jgi:3-methyl-2-oxobutanoate hydroxymethyltransferase
LTSYNKFFANIADEFCDLILVGDSMGTAYYGDKTTRQVSVDNIIRHAKSVRKGIKKAILVVDMPFRSYDTKAAAKKNALKIIKETNCDAVKLEGGVEIFKIVEYLVKNKINVMGHIGLLPQKIRSNKHYKIKGKTLSENNKILKDLKSLQDAGVFSIVLEAVKYSTAQQVIRNSNIPIIGIGASKNCDGQILVLEDMLGLFEKVPKFVKKYFNLKKEIKNAIKQYALDVRKGKFPYKKNIYY